MALRGKPAGRVTQTPSTLRSRLFVVLEHPGVPTEQLASARELPQLRLLGVELVTYNECPSSKSWCTDLPLLSTSFRFGSTSDLDLLLDYRRRTASSRSRGPPHHPPRSTFRPPRRRTTP